MRWGSKSTVDSQHAVDVRYLKKQGSLEAGKSGSLTWSRQGKQTGAISYQVKENGIMLIYNMRENSSAEWETVEQFVSFDYTPCNYGGKRTWLLCTHCNRRVTCIYVTGKYFLCRHCYGLNHQSQHEGYCDRLLSKAQSRRTKLGGSPSLGDLFPEKPKGMHWKTYHKLQDQAMSDEEACFQKIDEYLNRFSSRLS
ncbi:hypothetical protein [Bathymodiolus heckerae thiotrophic gill symbiont]|uniref:hypothetical protein n=1 Tax=Bathymodiolus heckerae thiotrophic gill symbiont TaxID=1052212 RepID=UPI001BB2016D|nr:hypothetical protein [Bathymodiolus heckerae thiotrophic gill symbiont]